MVGNAADGAGVMVLAIEALFEAMAGAQADSRFDLSLSYLEVYNERIRDLLAPDEAEAPPLGLTLRQDSRKGISVRSS